ncbi:MAG TPA: hypothetical protein VK524_02435 [Polyangiaceae bacterium]|nr:hypothetical protein [Polyangiaceae bacterium]
MFWKLIQRLQPGPRLRGAMRVFAYLFCINALLSVYSLRRATAAVEQKAENAGLQLLEQVGPLVVGPPQQMSINGQRMFLASKSTPLSVKEVLDRFDRHCRPNAAALGDTLAELPAHALAHLPKDFRDPSRWLMARGENGDGRLGQIACLARRQGDDGIRSLLNRLSAFATTFDVSRLGDMRYVTARRSAESNTTHVLTMWTQGKFDISAMFPEQGDVPGRDPFDAPRPPESVRVLSAEVTEQPYALHMYDTPQEKPRILAFYAEQMVRRGYAAHPLMDERAGVNLNEHARVFIKHDATVLVITSPTPDGKTGVSLVEMGSAGHISAKATVRP